MSVLVISSHWAPPVATQFSVLSQTFVKVRAPPVATLLFHLISSHHFSWHRLWRHSFLLFGHRQWRPLSFHVTAAFLWAPPVATQFSALSQTFVKVRSSCDPFVPFDFIASFLWAPPVATQFSVVRAPPVSTLVSSFHFITSFLWAPPAATQFSVVRAPPVATLVSSFHFVS